MVFPAPAFLCSDSWPHLVLNLALCTAVSSQVCVNYRMNVELQLGDGCNMSGDVTSWRPRLEAAALTSMLFSPGLWFSWATWAESVSNASLSTAASLPVELASSNPVACSPYFDLSFMGIPTFIFKISRVSCLIVGCTTTCGRQWISAMAYKGFVVCWLWEVSIVNSALLNSKEIVQCTLSCAYYKPSRRVGTPWLSPRCITILL